MTAATTRQACPVCDADLAAGAHQCPNCRTDLRVFAPTSELALDFYNDGLDLVRAGDRQGAIDKLRGAIASDPKLVDAYIVLGKLLAQSGKTGDLDQAIICWERARGLRPSGEQARKLDHCIETADGRLRQSKRQSVANRRNAFTGLIAGGLVLAALCGVAGYFIRPAQTATPVQTGNPALQNGAERSTTPQNPVAAVNSALNRPDITVARIGEKMALNGTVQSESERAVALAAAAYAAKTPASMIDASGLKVKPTLVPVAAKRVEHMLHLFVEGLGHGSTDPLANASLAVSGGTNKEPLKVTGDCTSPKAADEAARLVKEVYPSANPLDLSGLVVHARTSRPGARSSHIAASGLHTGAQASGGRSTTSASPSHVQAPTTSTGASASHPRAPVAASGTSPSNAVAPTFTAAPPHAAATSATSGPAGPHAAARTARTGHTARTARRTARRMGTPGHAGPPAVPPVVKRSHIASAQPAIGTGKAARKSPGDQVYINLSTKTYIVQPGDTIFGITKKYGHGAQWHNLWKANRGSIRNPDSIPAGTVLKLPQGWAPPAKPNDENQ